MERGISHEFLTTIDGNDLEGRLQAVEALLIYIIRKVPAVHTTIEIPAILDTLRSIRTRTHGPDSRVERGFNAEIEKIEGYFRTIEIDDSI